MWKLENIIGLLLACLGAAGVLAESLLPPAAMTDSGCWTGMGPGVELHPDGGIAGASSLYYSRLDPAGYRLPGLAVTTLTPKERYEFGVWVKAQNRGAAPVAVTSAVEFTAGNAYRSGVYLEQLEGDRDWTLLRGEFTMPEGADTATMIFYLPVGRVGDAWFSEPYLVPVSGIRWHVFKRDSFAPVIASGGPVALRIGSSLLGTPTDGKSVRLEVRRDGAVLHETTLAADAAEWQVEFPECVDELELAFTLVGADGQTEAEETLPLRIFPANTAIPANACRIDRFGHATVAGGKFLPVGIYLNQHDARVVPPRPIEDEIAILEDSPFNCFMSYDLMFLGLADSSATGAERTREVLDLASDAGLKAIVPLTSLDPADHVGITSWVEALRDHPALLAWYVCDEAPALRYPEFRPLRELVNRLDPWHPTWAVFCDHSMVPAYTAFSDIYGFDPYPIHSGPGSLAAVVADGDAIRETLGAGPIALWSVPQIFRWGSYNFDGGAGAATTRCPTEKEMRAIALLEAITGARGFIFYSYFDLHVDAATHPFAERWVEVCRVAELLRGLEGFLLSERVAPELELTVRSGTVRAAAFAAEDGRKAVLIACAAGGEAALRIEGGASLRSLYGNSRLQPDGSWLFQSNEADSDVLVDN